MQVRDYYDHDYIYKYFPKCDLETFRKDMLAEQGKTLYLLTYKKDDQDATLQGYNQNIYMIIGTLFVSVTSMIFYNKIPLIKRVQSKWWKFFMKAFILFAPVNVAALIGTIKIEQQIIKQYESYFPVYYKYKQIGDVKILNPLINISEY